MREDEQHQKRPFSFWATLAAAAARVAARTAEVDGSIFVFSRRFCEQESMGILCNGLCSGFRV